MNKKYKQYEDFYNYKTKQKLEQVQKKHDETLNNLEYTKKIKDNENLLLINNIVQKTQEIYQDNYYNNCNINNILYNYYKSDDPLIKKLLDGEQQDHNQLLIKEEEERKYEMKIAEKDKLKNENN